MSSAKTVQRLLMAAGCAGVVVTTAPKLFAQLGESTLDSDWRRGTRRIETPQNWAFELRFGPYYPRVDDEFSGKAAPFKQVFGDGGHFFFGVELDWQALRIPWVGTLGPGFGWGYTSMSSLAKKTGTNEDSAEETSLWIMPMHVVGVLRADVFAREMSIPIVPYAKLGGGFAFWKASNELGASSFQGISGKGHSYGLQLSLGAALQLDFLDASATQQLDNSVGINHAHVYLEWLYSDLGGLGGGQMRVGTSTWIVGLMFEL